MKNYIKVAIDGPAGSGKSTIAKLIAKKLDIEYLDTGAMYRAITLKVLDKEIDLKNELEVLKVLKNTKIDFIDNSIYLDGINVDDKIREDRINKNVSYIASFELIRDEMVMMQKEIAKGKSIIMDGRDISDVVLPDADYKYFLTATVEERGRRRWLETSKKGGNISLNQMIEDIRQRDLIDSNRKNNPLRISKEAKIIDTTLMTVDEVVALIIKDVKDE